jgi:hypothetical protein
MTAPMAATLMKLKTSCTTPLRNTPKQLTAVRSAMVERAIAITAAPGSG